MLASNMTGESPNTPEFDPDRAVPERIRARRAQAAARVKARRRRGRLSIATLSLLALAALGLDQLSSGQAGPSHGRGLHHRELLASPSNGSRRVIGCTGGTPTVVYHGHRTSPLVALSFDDGPGHLTPRVLSILNRLHARATFFEEGGHVAQHERLMRQILSSGDEIGNHSFHHPHYPGYRELAATNRRIRATTGFTPCLFRPPYGALDAKVLEAARRTHMKTVKWDVDSRDSTHPGAAVIHANAVGQARPGSIILMHDGGRHPQTVTALSGVIRALRARGFRFATVSRILGDRFVYRR